MIEVSLILCAHNPPPQHLQRTLASLCAQTLPRDRWELIVVDNASDTPLAEVADLSWHPLGRHVREDELGLAPARARGIRESRGGVLVFVDDDNLIAPDYLGVACAIAGEWPRVGVWGGSCVPEFETPPDESLRRYLCWMAVMEVDHVHVTTLLQGPGYRPIGAGMCLRRCIALPWAEEIGVDPARRRLGARGDCPAGSEDEDIRMSAVRLGYAMGVFPALSLVHLIPAERVTLTAFARLYEHRLASQMALAAAHGREGVAPSAAGFATAAQAMFRSLRRPGALAGRIRGVWTEHVMHRAARRAVRRFDRAHARDRGGADGPMAGDVRRPASRRRPGTESP